MATNFSDIVSDYDEMSFEELGTSLLERQESQRKLDSILSTVLWVLV